MTNAEIAKVFEEMAGLMEPTRENFFKIRAYQKVAKAIAEYPVEMAQLVKEGRLREVPGVGKAIARKITELVNTGRLQKLERLKAEARSREAAPKEGE